MPRTFRLVACAALWASSLSGQVGGGDSLYGAWCARCHGADARGVPAASVRTEVPPADLAGILTLYPQTWIRLSRLGHVAGSFGAGIPVNGPDRGQVTLTAFLLWDFGDGALLRGW